MKTSKQLMSWLVGAKSCVIFTGAGISTESGIPDFRSPGGVWAKYQPVYFHDFMQLESARQEYWSQKCEAHQAFADAQPNDGHRVIAGWESRELIRGVVTQNIDGLHQLAGNRSVLELHGTAREAQCMSCGDRNPIQPFIDQFMETNIPPRCEQCDGPLKHATISFGQTLEESVIQDAHAWMTDADLVLALGSSLVVHPAAGLPAVATENGARLVIINRDPTPLDEVADMVVHAPLGETLVALNQELS